MAYKSKEDQRKYAKQHYLDNKELYLKRAKEGVKRRRQERREFVNNLKATTPCADCGNYYPACVMDFDHISDKLENVSILVLNGTMTRILNEIKNCEIVCANCHRIRTYTRLAE